MSLVVVTRNPQTLLDQIKAAIDEGRVVTWQYDDDGDFTHTTASGQWRGRAWFRPHINSTDLTFGLLGQSGVIMTRLLYGVYHGRFIEMLLTHFDTEFETVLASAMMDMSVDRFETTTS